MQDISKFIILLPEIAVNKLQKKQQTYLLTASYSFCDFCEIERDGVMFRVDAGKFGNILCDTLRCCPPQQLEKLILLITHRLQLLLPVCAPLFK